MTARDSSRSLPILVVGFGGLSCVVSPVIAVDLLEEIVVTARKTTETRADVPLAIQAIEAEALASGLGLDLSRLSILSPGLYFESLWGGLGAAPVLRGQSQPTAAGDNVGVFVDGVYQAERTAIDSAPIDVQRVEIVRGPQSTLFGQSTFAGAIHYVPRLPTSDPTAGVEAVMGTDNYLSANAYVSGPVQADTVLGRLAVGYHDADGTLMNSANGGSLGNVQRSSVAGTLLSDWAGPWSVRLSGRWTSSQLGHPAVTTVDGDEYDCGAIDAATDSWSYFCGPLPVRGRYEVSPRIPESRLDVSQAALFVSWSGPRLELSSDTSYFRGSTDNFRDFDASAKGETFGVCVFPACPRGSGPPRPVNRLVAVNSVSRPRASTSEWAQEFRLRGEPSVAFTWMLGVTGFLTRQSSRAGFGFERGNLTVDERFAVLLPLTPSVAGPIARANVSLVDDPYREQVTQSFVESERRTFAAFGTLEYRLNDQWHLRAESRATIEYLEVAGDPDSSQKFTDTTPRISLQYAPLARSLLYVSAAKGSRSGGINSTVGLSASEQTFDPEYNWTYELGGRYTHQRWGVDATVYSIDWQNTQLLGYPTTAGINTLIVRNTVGVMTRGFELAFAAQPHDRLALRAAYSHAAPEFADGSDDPGSSAFCGLKGTTITSSFCTVGPPRSGTAPDGTNVPYIDGNAPPRAPEDQWSVTLTGDLSPLGTGWRLESSIDVAYQDDVYDRAINGARFGERTLLSASVSWIRGPWMLELWGSNLTDEQYVRGVSSRGAAFYPVAPRPLDLLYGEGRRVGLTLRYERP